jgi:hypothetical protein
MKPARNLLRAFLRMTGYGAITMPWGTVYALRERLEDAGLAAHEAVHVEQIKRLGAWRWTWQYLWGLARHGYKDNPLEAEARKKSGAA